MEKKFVILVGPSCSGKSSIISEVLKIRPDAFAVPLAATTRKPRPGESKTEYLFLSDDEFAHMKEDGELLESAMYAGCWYGLLRQSVQSVLDSGRIPIRAMEINGAMSDMPGIDKLTVFVDRSAESCLSDLLDRDIPKPEKIRRILRMADEKANAGKCDMVVDNNSDLLFPALEIIGSVDVPLVFDAQFVSRWNDEDDCRSGCKVDLQTGHVYDIQPSGCAPDGILTGEYVELHIEDGSEYVFEVLEDDDHYKVSKLVEFYPV